MKIFILVVLELFREGHGQNSLFVASVRECPTPFQASHVNVARLI